MLATLLWLGLHDGNWYELSDRRLSCLGRVLGQSPDHGSERIPAAGRLLCLLETTAKKITACKIENSASLYDDRANTSKGKGCIAKVRHHVMKCIQIVNGQNCKLLNRKDRKIDSYLHSIELLD